MEARYRVKTARLAASLTQSELAARAGVSQSLVAQIERGEREPGRNALRSLAEALGTSVSWLLGEHITEPEGDCALPPWLAGLISDGQSPLGLRALATDVRLIAVLGITDVEWRALNSIDLPAPASKDGYVNLLFTVRAIGTTPRRRSSSTR